MSKTRRGFTLVELLAVIVILAIILVIAVPSIMSTITESIKGAQESSAKLIASSAETKKLTNDTLGIDTNIECSDVAQLTTEDYAGCSIKFVDGNAKVTLVGSGKFEGMYVCDGTKENAEATEEACTGGSVETAVAKIENLAVSDNTDGLITDDTADHNIRYAGASPKNYISFNNELWRIIGTFNVTTSSGKTEKLMKIVKNESFSTEMSWDSSESGVNGGLGVNEWSQADLMIMLNTYYIGTSTTCNYCNNMNQGTCTNDCSSSVNQIDSAYRNMIENVVWNTGAITYADSIERSSAYTQERGTTTGKECTSGTYCNDTVERATTWTGKVGLIYPSDYGYASTSGTDIVNSAITTTNWLNSGLYWPVSPFFANSNDAFYVWFVDSDDCVYNISVSSWAGVRPSVYLKSDVSIISGDGSSSLPYQISMN